MVLAYIASWIINFVIIATIAAVVDEKMNAKIEEHQAVGAFLIFFVPTVLELASFFFLSKPFLFSI
jgi:hypothetical protein